MIINQGAGWVLVRTKGDGDLTKLGIDPSQPDQNVQHLDYVVQEGDEFMLVILWHAADFIDKWHSFWQGVGEAISTVFGWVGSALAWGYEFLTGKKWGAETKEETFEPESDDGAGFGSAIKNSDSWKATVPWVYGTRVVGSIEMNQALITYNGPRLQPVDVTRLNQISKRNWYNLTEEIEKVNSQQPGARPRNSGDSWYQTKNQERLHKHRSRKLRNMLLRNVYMYVGENRFKPDVDQPVKSEWYETKGWTENYLGVLLELWNHISKTKDLHLDKVWAEAQAAAGIISQYLLIRSRTYDGIDKPCYFLNTGRWVGGRLTGLSPTGSEATPRDTNTLQGSLRNRFQEYSFNWDKRTKGYHDDFSRSSSGDNSLTQLVLTLGRHVIPFEEGKKTGLIFDNAVVGGGRYFYRLNREETLAVHRYNSLSEGFAPAAVPPERRSVVYGPLTREDTIRFESGTFVRSGAHWPDRPVQVY